jgi:S-adenosylmethionine:tRNA ribosyltransferase-isomerase
MLPPFLQIDDFDYHLPDERIARYPLAERDQSKLLIYKHGEIYETLFYRLSEQLPAGTLLVRNNTKVIPVRLIYHKSTGAEIEIFCLNPVNPTRDIAQALQMTEETIWEAMVGHQKKWAKGEILTFESGDAILNAELVERGAVAKVRFFQEGHPYTFAELINRLGQIPIPPYLHRPTESLDNERYQTVYAQKEGSVAAPTAGLHFTDAVIQQLRFKNINIADLTLHVGAGTFKPVSESNALNHTMHAEYFEVSAPTLEQMMDAFPNIVAVGTTSLRSLESLYWLGVRKMRRESTDLLPQFYPYTQAEETLPHPTEVLEFLLKDDNLPVRAETSLMIVPGYRFRFCKGLITNFHQPKSTLLLLIAAVVGNDWKDVYDYALTHDFRFLSYGDSSLLWCK